MTAAQPHAGPVQLRTRPSMHSADLDGEVLIWDDGAQQLHRLNVSASRIWNELAQWRSVDDVVRAVDQGVDAERVARDVAECVNELDSAGLLERRRLPR